MIDWIYVGAVIFGAISLLIEADRNYRTSLSNHPFPYHAILEKVELENLCTPREWLSGFLFYSLLYLLAYVLILSSTELFLLVRNANLAELQVGANNEFVGPLSDPVSLADSTYGKPIFVSAFLIAFLSVGAMVDDIDQLFGKQPRIDCVAHKAGTGHAKVDFQMTAIVPGDGATARLRL